jgi:hypothetical protein
LASSLNRNSSLTFASASLHAFNFASRTGSCLEPISKPQNRA